MPNPVSIQFSKPENGVKGLLDPAVRRRGETFGESQQPPAARFHQSHGGLRVQGQVCSLDGYGRVPGGTDLDRLTIIGAGDEKALKSQEWMRLGGAAAANFPPAPL